MQCDCCAHLRVEIGDFSFFSCEDLPEYSAVGSSTGSGPKQISCSCFSLEDDLFKSLYFSIKRTLKNSLFPQ